MQKLIFIALTLAIASCQFLRTEKDSEVTLDLIGSSFESVTFSECDSAYKNFKVTSVDLKANGGYFSYHLEGKTLSENASVYEADIAVHEAYSGASVHAERISLKGSTTVDFNFIGSSDGKYFTTVKYYALGGPSPFGRRLDSIECVQFSN